MNPRTLVLGHRGARAVRSIPENTFASFDRALADGCDGFEFDVRLTGDGQAVVCHDPKVGGVEIARATEQELAGLPRFEDVLERYQETAFLDIELKVLGLEKITMGLLRSCLPWRGLVVSSFLPEALRVLRKHDATVPLGLICETRSQLEQWRGLPVDYVIPRFSLLNRRLLGEMKDAGKKVMVWTVNTSAGMRRYAKWGVEGIISDDPKLSVGTLPRQVSRVR
jgi:glycerophosphoryl diester phosphodiesterase